MGVFVISDWWQASISHLSAMLGVPSTVVLVFLTSALRSSDACSCPPENNYYNDYGSMDYESWESLLFQQQINTSDIVALVEVLGESKRAKRDAEPYYDYYGDYETTTYGHDYDNDNWDSERVYSVKVTLIKVTGEIICDKEFTTTFVTPYMDSMCGVSLEINEKYLLTKSDEINNFKPEDPELPEMRVEHCPRHQFWRWSELSDEQKGLLPKQDCVKESKDVGCWKNKQPTQLKRLEGSDARLDKPYRKRTEAKEKCFAVAKDAGYSFFSLGNKGQCWAGHGSDYNKQPKVKYCPAGGKGRYGVIHAYEIVNAAEPKDVCSTGAYSTCAYETEYCAKSWWNGKMWCRGMQGAYRDCTDGEQCLSGECSEWQQCEP